MNVSESRNCASDIILLYDTCMIFFDIGAVKETRG